MMKRFAVLFSLILLITVVATDAFGRVGGGRSSGFRSYKSTPTNPPAQRQTQESVRQPQQQPQAQPLQRPSFFNSGIFKTLVGGLLIGGLLSMLMGHGFQFGAPGLLEILLIGGVLFFIFRKVMQRKQAAQYQYATGSAPFSDEGTAPTAEPKAPSDVSINESFIKDIARSTFKTLQDAWSKGDMSIVRNLVTERMYAYLNDQLQELKRQGMKNIVEITYFQGVDIVEVGEEADKKVVVVQIDALMRDYTIDGNNTIVQGSNDTPVDVREYWAFVGKGLDWKLDDIRQV